MIVTRNWLNEFVDLSDVSNERLYKTLNAIGLEVDSIEDIVLPQKVVVGKVLSCEKHPDATKLNVCQVDVGEGIKQIVCGAANVVDATYVAVATVGAVLPSEEAGGLEIKDATLRGVESAGMICASAELGLPSMGEGIMHLDSSIGELEVGKPLCEYGQLNDTIIEIELTPNRGDCLSVYGVARDLSVALDRDMRVSDKLKEEKKRQGVAREIALHQEGDIDVSLGYTLTNLKEIEKSFLIHLRLAMVQVEAKGSLEAFVSYTVHTTGVILRVYRKEDFLLEDSEEKRTIYLKESDGLVLVGNGEKALSVVGVMQEDASKVTHSVGSLLIEVSYMSPEKLVEAVSLGKCDTDALYYKTSRGSNPHIAVGLKYFNRLLEMYTDAEVYEGALTTEVMSKTQTITVDIAEVSAIVGSELESSHVVKLLQKLGFGVQSVNSTMLAVTPPLFRHDIENIQDVAEEVLRMVGIDNIEPKALVFEEKARLNGVSRGFQIKKALRERAVGVGFYEHLSYLFTDRAVLEKYGFVTVVDEMELLNPIVEELNTLRTTLLTNMLLAGKRNVSYSKKSMALFELGSVFNEKREESVKLAFFFSGEKEQELVSNSGKPERIDFATFVQKLSSVIGGFDLKPCSFTNGLVHPYQSADIVIGGSVVGFMTKLHPTAQEAYDLPVSFVAELSYEALIPKHIDATPISRFQGVTKDLSVVLEGSIGYYEIKEVLDRLALPTLKSYYPIDVYSDEVLVDKQSLTLRFHIQSMEKTLEDSDMEKVTQTIMETLSHHFNAELR
jgi:phenylalanyl-tRNA synthetase beta chain